jgi:hypothetical protein
MISRISRIFFYFLIAIQLLVGPGNSSQIEIRLENSFRLLLNYLHNSYFGNKIIF